MKRSEWGCGTRWCIFKSVTGEWAVSPPDVSFSGRYARFRSFDDARLSFIEQTRKIK